MARKKLKAEQPGAATDDAIAALPGVERWMGDQMGLTP